MFQFRKFLTNININNPKKLARQSPVPKRVRCLSTMEVPPKQRVSLQIPKGVMGQPTYYTHPHLVPEGQLTFGVTQAEYNERRTTLVNKLIQTPNFTNSNHIVVIPAASKQYMSDRIPYVFRQNSDFFYLTGCLEPSAVLVIIKNATENHFKSILFVHDNDEQVELWEGPRTGCTNSAKMFQMDEARPIQEFSTFINSLTPTFTPTTIWYNNENKDMFNTIRDTVRKEQNFTLCDPKLTIHKMRVIKSSAEIELMKNACHIGSKAMNMAMACTKPGMSEHCVNAVLEYSSKLAGAEHLAFPPVVAGGNRATHIHYVNNNQLLRGDELLLVDSGCQRWLYNSDISRTWPVSGKFKDNHLILYELVLTVQKRLIELIGEHRPPLDKLFDSMCRLLGLHLQQEGILPKVLEGHELLEKAYRLCPHHVSHYLGLDVHDSPLIKRNIPICSNMVVTVEPGIYIRPDDTSVPAEFRGIGIRIEDDVLITDGAPIVLTSDCVKEVADIQAIVGTNNSTNIYVA